MNDTPTFVAVLMFVVLLLAIAGGAMLMMGYHFKAKDALLECERELPRNQHCIITAIPEEHEK